MVRIGAMAAIALSLFALPNLLSAQGITGTISGRVTDTQGAVVPGAQVTVTNIATGVATTRTTNGAGLYSVPSLPSGQYDITITAAGFKDAAINGIILSVQGDVNRNTVLEPGAATSTVTVNAGTNSINTTTATVSTVINRQFMENMPMNGRSFQTLIELTPGVVPGVASYYSQGQFTVNGQRADSNYYTVDGVSANFGGASGVNIPNAGGSLPAFSAQGGTNSLVSVDAVQEFRIQTSTFAPEFGRTPGAQIAIETRSGTNQFHGNVFDYFRNDAMDANGWFDNYLGLRKPVERVNDFGGILGGPLYRNKAFFFFSYEGQRLNLPETTATEVPANTPVLDPLTGTLVNPRTGAPRALQPFMNAFPLPNGPALADGSMLALVANLLLAGVVFAQRHADVYIHNLGLYAQDTWRTTPRLTLTYGLRWDVDFTPTLGNGLNFVAVTGFGGNGSNLGIAPPGTPLYKTTYGNVAPRFGFNYQLDRTPSQETVLRGGFGIFYDLASQAFGTAVSIVDYPFGKLKLVPGPLLGGTASFPFTPADAAPPAISLTPPLTDQTVFNPNLKLPYTYEYNLAVERALGGNQSLSVSYVGATGRRLLQTSVGGNVNSTFAAVTAIDNTSASNYNALQVQFKRQVTQGLQALAAYTWSHSIDTASSDSNVGSDDYAVLGQNPNVNRGPSDFDFRNSGSLGLTYAMPKLQGSFLRRNLLGGWSANTLVLAYSAPPLTVTDGNLQFPSLALFNARVRPDIVPGVPFYLHGSQYPGGKAINPAAFKDPPFSVVNGVPIPLRQGTLGRNSLRGLGVKQWDFSFQRDFLLPKTLDLQFRAELFNIVNHPNFGGFNTNFTTPLQPNFGQATETLAQSLGSGGAAGGFNPLFQIGGPRSIQLALKLMF